MQVGALFPTPNVLSSRHVFHRKTYRAPVYKGVRSKYNSTHHELLRYSYYQYNSTGYPKKIVISIFLFCEFESHTVSALAAIIAAFASRIPQSALHSIWRNPASRLPQSVLWNSGRFFYSSMSTSICSSLSCSPDTLDGAFIIRSLALAVFGKAMTSRMLSVPASSMTKRSKP